MPRRRVGQPRRTASAGALRSTAMRPSGDREPDREPLRHEPHRPGPAMQRWANTAKRWANTAVVIFTVVIFTVVLVLPLVAVVLVSKLGL